MPSSLLAIPKARPRGGLRVFRAGVHTIPLPRNWPLLVIWSTLAACLLFLGALTTFTAFAWLPSSPLPDPTQTHYARALVLDKKDVSAAMVLGVSMLAVFLYSLPALLVDSKESKRLLIILNILLSLLGVLVIGAASVLWYRTLQERQEFSVVWSNIGGAGQARIQEDFKCCGYWDASSAVPQGVCALTNRTPPSLPVCVDPFTKYANKVLNLLSTMMYAYMGIVVLLIIATCCIINERTLRTRFRKIDDRRKTLLFG